ncbi:hypothetical protein [Maridesulfovibrio sp.]|uniref:hypothetical protein n=1 Tax=Maridesulfovibrio sp. TaxID=2795000 RepID=UPI002A1885E3|nr:hypothetical protein [Maridesulfovibrio sp.]
MHLAACAVLLALFLVPYDDIRTERIRAFGEKSAVGTVIGKQRHAENSGSPGSSITDYLIRYRFVDPSGLPRNREARVDEDFWKEIVPGDSVVVHFAKAAPRVSRVEHEVESSVVRFLARFSRADVP